MGARSHRRGDCALTMATGRPHAAAARGTSAAWYVMGGGLLMIAAALAGIGLSQAASTVQDMQRIEMPGRASVVLPPRATTLYVEGAAPTTVASCALTSESGGAPATVSPTAAVRTYDSEGYRGTSIYDVEAPTGGTYTLACAGSGRFQIAIGQGAGAARVLLLAAILPALAGVAAMILVAWKRRRPSSADQDTFTA